MMAVSEREQWFIDRIGKRLFRPDTKCSCSVCADVYQNGLIVSDKNHAIYLAEMEFFFSADNIPMRYFETKEEAVSFENINALK